MYTYGRQPVYWTIPNELGHAERLSFFTIIKGRDKIELKDFTLIVVHQADMVGPLAL
jgi:hypothetical protein